MSSVKQVRKNSNNVTYSLLAFYDIFGAGYLVQADEHVPAAIRDGWTVIMSGRTRAEADYALNLYKTVGKPETTPNTLDLELTYDFTEPVETRKGQTIQEFDLVKVMLNGVWVDATVTYYDADCVEFDGHFEVEREYAEANIELIAKAEANDFILEYGAYLDTLEENWNAVYNIALRAQQTGVAA